MSRIARAVFRLTHAFGADPELMLTRPEVEYLAELDADELDVVLDALTTGGVLVHSGPAYRAGSRSGPTAVRVRQAPGPPDTRLPRTCRAGE